MTLPADRDALLLRQITDDSADVIYAKDIEGRLLYANPAALVLIGKPLDAVLGRTDAELLEDADAARAVMENDRRIMRTGEAEEVEERVPMPDGSERVWLSRKSPRRDASGRVIGLLGISRDITDRRRVARERERLAQHRQLALDAAHMGWWHYDPQTRVARYDERYTQIFGVSGGERANDEILRLLHPEDLPRVWAAVEAALDPRDPRPYRAEYRIRRPDGVELWIEAHGLATFEGEGEARRATSLVGTVADITERRRAVDALRASEERWNAAIENFGEGAIIATEDERLVYWNRAARAMHGLGEGEGLEVLANLGHIFELWTLDGGRRLEVDEWPMRRIKRGETVRHLELRLRRTDQGWERFASYSGAMVRTAAGERLIFLSVSDLTEQRRAEHALREADRRKDEFLAMLAHELRNPLAPIRNATYLLQHARNPEQAARARAVIQRQTEHLTRLVDDLLDVTRIARGKVELRLTRVDLREVVSRAAEDFRFVLRDRGVRFEVEVPEAPVWADADATRVTQIVGNLLHNASKFTREGDLVRLSLEGRGGVASLRVLDTGAGIDPELLPHLFQAFVQGSRTLARTEGGLGLGLALVKGIAELHGGSVHVVSAGEGRGTEFLVQLPVVVEAHAATGPAEHPTVARAGRRVLVVDDNPDAAETLADLVRMLGHEADVAHDGPGAIRAVRENHPDTVLCDIGLPGMDGYEVARALRTLGQEGLRLVAVSGYAQPEDVRRSAEAGFDVHVAKPADPAEIERLLA